MPGAAATGVRLTISRLSVSSRDAKLAATPFGSILGCQDEHNIKIERRTDHAAKCAAKRGRAVAWSIGGVIFGVPAAAAGRRPVVQEVNTVA